MDSVPSPSADFAVDEGVTAAAAPLTPAAEPAGPWIENPPWIGFDLLLLTCVFFFGLVLFSAIFLGVLHSLRGRPVAEIAGNVSVWIAVPAMAATYLTMFAVIYLLARGRGLKFWAALSWNWPRGFAWTAFLLGGVPLAVVVGLLQRMLPMPKELPIEKLFFQPGAPQLLALFGVIVAPFVEETLFRGLLYPVANRWLREVLNSQQRLRRGRMVFLCLIPWGFASQWHLPMGGVLLAVTALIATGGLCAWRGLEGRVSDAVRPILAGVAFFGWALLATQMSRVFLIRASLVLLVVVSIMTVMGMKLLPGATATRIGIGCSFALTAVIFTLLHAEQLGGSFAPLLVLLVVSTALTFVRAYTKSLAASFLIHVGYNSMLFGSMYIATDHFRHFEHLTR